MKLENQFCTPEQGIALYNAGVEKKALFTTAKYESGGVAIFYGVNHGAEAVCVYQRGKCEDAPLLAPAFSVAELGIMLPQGAATCFDKTKFRWIARIDFLDELRTRVEVEGKTEAIARAKLLLQLIEGGHAHIDLINKRLEAF